MREPIHRLAGAPRAMLAVAFLLVLVLAGCAADETSGTSSPPGSDDRDVPAVPSATASEQPSMGSPAVPPSSTDEAPSPSAAAFDDPLLRTELRDVRTGSTFTLAELAAEEPVIVETMAIWCTNCRSQMHQVTAAHDLAAFHSVSIDVDRTEIAEDLAAYAEREGFDWPFVLADAELATMLRDRFGEGVTFPPGMPKILVRPDGSVELLPLGELLSAEQIAALVEG